MKFSILLLATWVVITSAFTEEEDQIFNDYISNFNIRIPRSSDVNEIKKTLIETVKDVAEHNQDYDAGKVPYQLAVNEFSYLDYDSQVKLRTGLGPEEENDDYNHTQPETPERRGRAAAPASWSWSDVNGVVRAVQNQGGCGSCWSFAALGAIEGQMAIKKGLYDKLAEQEVIECARHRTTGALLGCNGGWHYSAYDHARDRNGVTKQANRPYRANTNYACTTSTARTAGSRTVEWYAVNYMDEKAMKEALFSIGPLYVTFYASSDIMNFYGTGVYTDSRLYCKSTSANNHAVLLVGYGTLNGIDYWLLKNSWGTAWGDKGFFKLQRGRNLCGISKTVNYPVLP